MKVQAPTFKLRERATAAGVHLIFCAIVAMMAAVLVFGLWYPWPYREVAGGQSLFVLVLSVDLVLGPLLTFSVFDSTKGWRHLRRDLTVIAFLQIAALTYGLHTVYEVRPVALVFEKDRFRVIAAADVHLPELSAAPEQYRHLPLTGPLLLGTRQARDAAERSEALSLGLNGIDIGQRPTFWQPYADSRADVLARSRPVDHLFKQYPQGRATIEATLRESRLTVADARFLPLSARRQWVVLLNYNGEVAGFAPFDGFF
ncbi:MAG: hypothetical protein Tsb007_07200 [Rhizobacter sp.]